MADQEFYILYGSLRTDIDPDDRDMTNLERIDMSIRKWEAIVAYYETGDAEHTIDCGADSTCALCWIYAKYYCSHCPVRDFTGRSGCHGTPYYHYTRAAQYDLLEEAKKFAKEEVVFLKRVRELVVERDGEDG